MHRNRSSNSIPSRFCSRQPISPAPSFLGTQLISRTFLQWNTLCPTGTAGPTHILPKNGILRACNFSLSRNSYSCPTELGYKSGQNLNVVGHTLGWANNRCKSTEEDESNGSRSSPILQMFLQMFLLQKITVCLFPRMGDSWLT